MKRALLIGLVFLSVSGRAEHIGGTPSEEPSAPQSLSLISGEGECKPGNESTNWHSVALN